MGYIPSGGGTMTQAQLIAAGVPVPVNLQSGRYYFLPNDLAIGTANTLGNGVARAAPFYIPNTVTINRIGAEITLIGDVGSKLRLGIWNDDGTGRPGTVALDAGQIAGDSATVQELVCNVTLAPGWYHRGGIIQAAATTQPTVRIDGSGVWPGTVDTGVAMPGAGTVPTGFQMAAAGQGALPTFVVSGGAGSVPRMFFKVA